MSQEPSLLEVPVDPMVGRQIGSYVVEQLLGAGGMGSVYRCVQPAIGKKVAAKFLAAQFNEDPHIVARFFDEAKAVNLIGHENIVDIFDFGRTAEGRSYFVMEWLDGPSLERVLEDAVALSPARAVDIAGQIARALVAAHARGIIHRDLKPENVFLLRRAGRADFVKVLDFGIAKLARTVDGAEPSDRRTQVGAILGTPGYMSPEQASGDEIDARTDVYSLGVLVYRMLGGELPFAVTTHTGTLLSQLTEKPRPLASLRADVPPALDALVADMLAPSAADRPATMAAVADTLAELAAVGDLGHDIAWIEGAARKSGERPWVLGQLPTALAPPKTQVDSGPPAAVARRRVVSRVGIAAVGVAAVAAFSTGWYVTSRRVHGGAVVERGAGAGASSRPGPGTTATGGGATAAAGASGATRAGAVAAPGATSGEASASVGGSAVPSAPPVGADPPRGDAPPVASAFVLHVDTTPSGGRIFDGDRLVGTAPADVRLDRARPLVVRLPGYRDERVETSTDHPSLHVTLRPKRGAAHPHGPGGISLDD